MNGLPIGRLECLSQGQLRFQYGADWLAEEASPPISLSLPLSPDPYAGDRVWSFFDNLLPDSDDIKRRMQRSLGAESTRPFDLLAAAGGDCVGALQLYASGSPADVRWIDATPVSDAW